MTDEIKKVWHRFAGLASILLIAISLILAGMALMYWINRSERMQLVSRFPQARATAAASATEAADAKYATQIASLKSENDTLKRSQELIAKSVADTNQIASYTLRFLGDRAKLTDARQAVLIKQTRQATAAATVAAQKTEAVEQKVVVIGTTAAEAASTAKAVDKKLDTAVHPALPPQPWAGNRR